MSEQLTIQNEANSEPEVSQECEISPELQELVDSRRPWSPTPSGRPADNPLVRQIFFDMQQAELDMVEYGKKDLEFAEMAPLVEVAYLMRHHTRMAKASEGQTNVLFPEVKIPDRLLLKDELGAILQHESMFLMKERGMKSKELGKVTHLYGGHALTYVDVMYTETMNYLNDLKVLSLGLKENSLHDLSEDDFSYIKDPETLGLIVETLTDKRNDDSVIDVELMNTSEHAYYRIVSRDWSAPEGTPGIIMLKHKIRLGMVGSTEVVMRTSFMVNLDELSSEVNEEVLEKVKSFAYDENWSDNILSEETGLVAEIERLGLSKDPYSFILISTTIYAKDAVVEEKILEKNKQESESKKVWNPILNAFI